LEESAFTGARILLITDFVPPRANRFVSKTLHRRCVSSPTGVTANVHNIERVHHSVDKIMQPYHWVPQRLSTGIRVSSTASTPSTPSVDGEAVPDMI
jgi:hypothetical protein